MLSSILLLFPTKPHSPLKTHPHNVVISVFHLALTASVE